MAKYSTGSGSGREGGGSCELCGRESTNLRRATIAGANLLVCENCAPHGENSHTDRTREQSETTRDDGKPSRKKRAAQRAAKLYDRSRGDPSRWEREGTNYEEDRLPYLVSGYGDVVEAARQDAGLQVADLAAELDVDEADLLAVEQGRATRAGVGGSVIRKLEARLDVELTDE